MSTPAVAATASVRAELDRAGRRAVPVLSVMQVVGGVGVASGIAVNGLLAQQISGSAAWSGMAQTMAVIGAALLAVPLARLAQNAGRRPALALGYAVAVLGAALSVVAGVTSRFWLLLIAATLFGGGTASGLQSRYAAIDAAGPTHRGRSLALVMWAGTLGSVLGPNLSELGGRLGGRLGIPTLTGPFLFSVVAFSTAAVVGLLWLRPDPLLAARAVHEDAGRPAATGGLRTAVTVVRTSRGATTGLVGIATAHAVMVGVMVMTPVHLHGDGATLRVIGIVISVHIAGMYAASPLMGILADRVGRPTGILVGQVLLAASLLVAATSPPHADVQLGVALTLLGLGWSATVVAASTLITESVPAQVRTTVQGLSDLVMGLAAALAGALAGPVLQVWGYHMLAWLAGLLLIPATVSALTALSTRSGHVAVTAAVE